MSKPRLSEYLAKKLPHYKKKRHRLKIFRDGEKLWTNYCFKKWGMQGLLWCLYSEVDLSCLIYKNNPFMSLLNKDDRFAGKYIPVPHEVNSE